MSSWPKKQYREFYAANLSQIEPGLILIQEEYLLKNAIGTRGFVDILARDVFGHTVIIELKRSGSTSREALHELNKYVESLRHEFGLSLDSIRCIVLSLQFSSSSQASPNAADREDF